MHNHFIWLKEQDVSERGVYKRFELLARPAQGRNRRAAAPHTLRRPAEVLQCRGRALSPSFRQRCGIGACF